MKANAQERDVVKMTEKELSGMEGFVGRTEQYWLKLGSELQMLVEKGTGLANRLEFCERRP